MAEARFRQLRPFKVVALFMVFIAIILIIASLAGPDWVSVTFENGKVRSWGLWEDCSEVNTSFKLCVSNDWLGACAALVVIALFGDLLVIVLGVTGLCLRRRLPYLLAGVFCLVTILCLVVSLIIYPVKFSDEVKGNEDYKKEATEFLFDWTYGLAWGAVCFLICAAVFFFIRVPEEHEEVRNMKSVQHRFYEADNTASFS